MSETSGANAHHASQIFRRAGETGDEAALRTVGFGAASLIVKRWIKRAAQLEAELQRHGLPVPPFASPAKEDVE